jgi:hypothetical protein
VERQKEVLAERERELVRRVQAAREEEFHKTAIVHEEKLGSISLTDTLSHIHTVSDYFVEIVCIDHVCVMCVSQEVGVTLIGEGGLVVMAGAEWY